MSPTRLTLPSLDFVRFILDELFTTAFFFSFTSYVSFIIIIDICSITHSNTYLRLIHYSHAHVYVYWYLERNTRNVLYMIKWPMINPSWMCQIHVEQSWLRLGSCKPQVAFELRHRYRTIAINVTTALEVSIELSNAPLCDQVW